jgi:GNAT superfamily N-acetyltransferase
MSFAPHPPSPELPAVALRCNLKPDDVPAIVKLHGAIYAREHGFDPSFESYVAGPLAEFARTRSDRDRIWIAERDGRIVGCIAIVAVDESRAQLRWFLVDRSLRGAGLGSRLLREAIEFSRRCGYTLIFLWTVSALTAAARLYTRFGFRRVEEHSARLWGVEVVEERYDLDLVTTPNEAAGA